MWKNFTNFAQKLHFMKHLCYIVIVSFCALSCVLMPSCVEKQHTYRIGVSQCLDDAWREKMNSEMERELLHYDDMELRTRIAYGSNELQCMQIDSFIAEDVDLLIVSPNEAYAVRPAVTRAYRAGIPVIVADRRVMGNEWTAFIGGDNRKSGMLMGEWVAKHQAQSKRPLQLLEVTGLPGSTPATLRHEGMMEVLEPLPVVVHSVVGSWYEDSARVAVEAFLHDNPELKIDLIVAQNDLMAIGASEALDKDIPIMGVDGIAVGLQAIIDGKIECTATYSSRGDLVIDVAHAILNGEPYNRDTVLETTIVDVDAARALMIQYRERVQDLKTLSIVRSQLSDFGSMYRIQMTSLIACFVCVCILFVLFMIYLLFTHRQLSYQIQEEVVPQMEDVMHKMKLSSRDVAFVERLQQLVDSNLANPDLTVEYLGSELSLSRTQAFRRIKSVTGKSPLEYIRERRLARANELLSTTDMTVQQVANHLCFSSPSYFSKCYKEMFSVSPSTRQSGTSSTL